MDTLQFLVGKMPDVLKHILLGFGIAKRDTTSFTDKLGFHYFGLFVVNSLLITFAPLSVNTTVVLLNL